MKWVTFLLFASFLFTSCQQGLCQQPGKLSTGEIVQIKSDIIKRSEKHAKDLLKVTMHVTHNYDVFDEIGAVRKWWLKYSPENRKDAQ
jgi:hypothetical protein